MIEILFPISSFLFPIFVVVAWFGLGFLGAYILLKDLYGSEFLEQVPFTSLCTLLGPLGLFFCWIMSLIIKK
jgi:hypothetical protein